MITPAELQADIAFAVASASSLLSGKDFLRDEALMHSLAVAVRQCYPQVKTTCFRMVRPHPVSEIEVVLPTLDDALLAPGGLTTTRDLAPVLNLVYPTHSAFVGIGSSHLRKSQGDLVAHLRDALQSQALHRKLQHAADAPIGATPRPRF